MSKKRLSKKPVRVVRAGKLTAKQGERENSRRAQLEAEFQPHPVPLAKQVIARLKNAREAAGVSLSTLEQRTGMSVSNLSRLENANEDVKLSTLETYAQALGLVLNVTTTIGNPPTKDDKPAPPKDTRPRFRALPPSGEAVAAKRKPRLAK